MSVAGTSFLDTPWILPLSGYLEHVKRLMVSDVYISGCRQRGLGASKFGQPFKLSSRSREEAIRLYLQQRALRQSLEWTLSARGSSATVASPRRATRTPASHVTVLSFLCLKTGNHSLPTLRTRGAGLSGKAARGATQRWFSCNDLWSSEIAQRVQSSLESFHLGDCLGLDGVWVGTHQPD